MNNCQKEGHNFKLMNKEGKCSQCRKEEEDAKYDPALLQIGIENKRAEARKRKEAVMIANAKLRERDKPRWMNFSTKEKDS